MSPTWFYTLVAGGSLMLSMWQPVDAATEAWNDSPHQTRASAHEPTATDRKEREDAHRPNRPPQGSAREQASR